MTKMTIMILGPPGSKNIAPIAPMAHSDKEIGSTTLIGQSGFMLMTTVVPKEVLVSSQVAVTIRRVPA